MANMTVTLRLGSDPVYKQVNTKKGIVNALDLSGADVTERENSGESPWYRVTLWNKYADAMAQYLQKGTIVVVSGKLTTRAYQSKSGNLLVEKAIADAELSIVTGGKHNQQQPQQSVPQVSPATPQPQQAVSPAPQAVPSPAVAPATTANNGFQPLTAEEIKDLPY